MGEFSFLEEGRDCDECECAVCDDRSVVGGQPAADWTDNDDDVMRSGDASDAEKSTESDHLTKDGGDAVSTESGPVHRQRKLFYQIGKTIIMVLAPAVMALFLELVGPTLLDLMRQSGSNFEQISGVLVARSIGILLGSLAGGFLTDRFPNVPELFMSCSFIVGAFGTSMIPWMDDLALLGLTFHIQGIAFGFFDVCNNHLCIKIWKEKASCPIHALHFGYGLGALVAPQLARPFVEDDPIPGGDGADRNGSRLAAIPTDGDANATGNGTARGAVQSNIAFPYLISAAVAVVFCVIFCLFYVFERCLKSGVGASGSVRTVAGERTGAERRRRRETTGLAGMLNPGSCTGGDRAFGAQFFGVSFFLFFNAVGGEHGYTKFLYTYAREGPLHLSGRSAATVNTLFWACFMAGRGVAIFASRLVHPRPMLVAQLAVVLVSAVALCLWAGDVVRVLWIFTGLFAAFLGPIMPSGISWCNRYVLMKGTAVAMVFLATGTGSITYQWLIGYLFEHHGASSLMYVMVGFAVFIAADFAVLLVIVRGKSERFADVITTEVDEKGNISLVVEASDDAKDGV